MSTITPKNWDTFQHYRDRRPQWIKLHKLLLDDYVFQCLPVDSRALAPMMWLLASEYEDGEITASLDEIGFRMRMNVANLEEALRPLIAKGFFETDIARISALATPEPKSSPEREGETQVKTQEQKEGEVAQAAPDASKVTKAKGPKQAKLDLGEAKKKPTRLTADWKLSTRNNDDARAEGLSEVQMAQEAKSFRNYWVALAGPKALKLDWDATWHNWCLRFAKDKGLVPRPEFKAAGAQAAKKDPVLTIDEWKLILRNYAQTSNWKSVYGPPPGAVGCLVPKELLPDDLTDPTPGEGE